MPYQAPDSNTFTFESSLWLWDTTKGAWHFLTLPADLSEFIRQEYKYLSAGWGSVKVIVLIGETEWETSMFWDAKMQRFILPVKAMVRRAEKLELEAIVPVQIKIKFAL